MANDYGIIVCDESRYFNAKSLGRNAAITKNEAKTWRCDLFKKGIKGAARTENCNFRMPCNGTFTGHVIILMHGNYHPSHTSGKLYLEQPKGTYSLATKKTISYVKALGATKIYLFACGQGTPTILSWYRGESGFDVADVSCPCVTAAMGGSLQASNIASAFGW